MRRWIKFLFCALPCFAQVDTGDITGVVSDRSGAVVPGVKVQIVQIETNSLTALQTNDAGFYSAPSLRPGRYDVTVTKEGFHSQKSQPFDLRVQDRAEVSFQLEVGSTTSEVTVTATASLLESETSSLGQVVEERNIADLPLNGRNFIQLAILGPGTSPAQRTAERDSFVGRQRAGPLWKRAPWSHGGAQQEETRVENPNFCLLKGGRAGCWNPSHGASSRLT